MESISSRTSEDLRPRSIVGKPPTLQNEAKVSKIVQSFNTWAFKREQPSDLPLLTCFAMRAVMRQEPLSFVLYWGKGPRSEIESPDIECLDYLASLATRVKNVYDRGALVSLVLTDTHATLNGHPEQEITKYLTQVAREARKRGFEHYSLGELTAAAGNVARTDDCPPPSEETLQRLADSAMRWYRGEGTAEQGARKYYMMNMVERQVIELFFPSSIFITFNGREHRDLFPQRLPIFYMYSLRRGTSIKPWFLPHPELGNASLAS